MDKRTSERQITIGFAPGTADELAQQQIEGLYRWLAADWLKDTPTARGELHGHPDAEHKASEAFQIVLAIAAGAATGVIQIVPSLIESIKSWRENEREKIGEEEAPPTVSLTEDGKMLAQVDDGSPDSGPQDRDVETDEPREE